MLIARLELFTGSKKQMRHALTANGLVLSAAALAAIALGLLVPLSQVGAAEEEAEVTISLKDHKFDPAEIKVPAAKAIKLTVKNLDATPEEFESHPLGVEKVIAGNGTATIRLKPLAKGSYAFVGEYHEETAKGKIVAE
jgi:plastocyanin